MEDKKPFPHLDGREEKTKYLRRSAIDALGGSLGYQNASYMRRSLACRAAMLGWMIDHYDLSASEITQAHNAWIGVYKRLEENGSSEAPSMPYVSKDEILEAVFNGVKSAVWDVATNATDMPCSDFYDSIRQGVESATKDVT